jgi:hypothetical protein
MERRMNNHLVLILLLAFSTAVFGLDPWIQIVMSTDLMGDGGNGTSTNGTNSTNSNNALYPQIIPLTTAAFRTSVTSAVAVAVNRITILSWTINGSLVDAQFSFVSGTGTDSNQSSVALTVKLQSLLQQKTDQSYWRYLYPLNIVRFSFDPLLPSPTENQTNTSTPKPPPTPAPPHPPTPIPWGVTPIPTPLPPVRINGSGEMFNYLDGEEQQTSMIYIIVIVVIGVLIVAGFTVGMVKFCMREKKTDKQSYGRVVR